MIKENRDEMTRKEM